MPRFRWPLSRTDIATLLFTMALCGAAWPFGHIIFLTVRIYYGLRGWLWLCRRHPLIAWIGFLQGLFSGRRR
jgi:hypothetical protein